MRSWVTSSGGYRLAWTPPGHDLLAPGPATEPAEQVEVGGSSLGGHGVSEHRVGAEQVVGLQGRNLVLDQVGVHRANVAPAVNPWIWPQREHLDADIGMDHPDKLALVVAR